MAEYASDMTGMLLSAPTGCTFAGPRLELLALANFGARRLMTMPASAPGVATNRAFRPRPEGL